jgi:hypothetical protein
MVGRSMPLCLNCKSDEGDVRHAAMPSGRAQLQAIGAADIRPLGSPPG